MELKRISYKSAIFFVVVAVVLYFFVGILQILLGRDPAYVATYGIVSPLQALVYAPILGAVISYLFTVMMIFIYNIVAVKYPISWTVKK
jgi:hypothetical protein